MKPRKFFPAIKSILALLLISSLFLHASCRLGVLTWFYLNQSYIAAELCINRFEPASDCAGSCQLNSTLSQLDKEEKALPDYLQQVQEIILDFADNTPFAPKQSIMAKTAPEWSAKTVKHDFRINREIFEPPRAHSFF